MSQSHQFGLGFSIPKIGFFSKRLCRVSEILLENRITESGLGRSFNTKQKQKLEAADADDGWLWCVENTEVKKEGGPDRRSIGDSGLDRGLLPFWLLWLRKTERAPWRSRSPKTILRRLRSLRLRRPPHQLRSLRSRRELLASTSNVVQK